MNYDKLERMLVILTRSLLYLYDFLEEIMNYGTCFLFYDYMSLYYVISNVLSWPNRGPY